MRLIKFSLAVLTIALIVSSCASGGKAVTNDSYQSVFIGMSETELKAQLGEPVFSDNIEGGKLLKYNEKILLGTRIVQERQYIFEIRRGKVVNKKVNIYTRKPLDKDVRNERYPGQADVGQAESFRLVDPS